MTSQPAEEESGLKTYLNRADGIKVAAQPEAEATVEEQVDLAAVTHVVINLSDARQTQVLELSGYRFDSNIPGPSWCFFARIVGQALYSDPTRLALMNSFRLLNSRDFVAFTVAKGPLTVVEVGVQKPRPGEPLRFYCKPAGQLMTQKIRQWMAES